MKIRSQRKRKQKLNERPILDAPEVLVKWRERIEDIRRVRGETTIVSLVDMAALCDGYDAERLENRAMRAYIRRMP